MRAALLLVWPTGALPEQKSVQAQMPEDLSRGFSGATASSRGARVDLKLQWAVTTQSCGGLVLSSPLLGDVTLTRPRPDSVGGRNTGRKMSLPEPQSISESEYNGHILNFILINVCLRKPCLGLPHSYQFALKFCRCGTLRIYQSHQRCPSA